MIGLQSPILMKPTALGLRLADRNQDIRGRIVVDVAGREIGHVKDLLIDTVEHKVWHLSVGFGGCFGIGGQTLLVPVDAITDMRSKTVHVDLSRQRVLESPRYDPPMTQTQVFPRASHRSPVDLDPVYPRYPHQWR